MKKIFLNFDVLSFLINTQVRCFKFKIYIIIKNKNFLNKFIYKYLFFVNKFFKTFVFFFEYKFFIFFYNLSFLFKKHYFYKNKLKFNKFHFCFSNFFVNNHNILVKNILINFVTKNDVQVNFITMYGPQYVGKTHLLFAVFNYLCLNNKKVIFFNSRDFVCKLIYFLHKGRIKIFKKFYQSADIIIIDDIHYLFHAIRSQEEIIYIIDFLFLNKQRLILSLRNHPLFSKLDERLINRILSNVLLELKEHDLYVKIKILIYKSLFFNIHLSYDIILLIINTVSNISSLSGILKTIISYSFFSKKLITIDLVKCVVRSFYIFDDKFYSMSYIVKKVFKYYGIFYFDISLEKKNRNFIFSKQMSIYLCKKLTSNNLIDLSNFFNLNYKVILYSYKNIEKLIKKNKNVFNDYFYFKNLFFLERKK